MTYRIGTEADAIPLPRRTLSTILGFTLRFACFNVMSDVSFGVNEIAQSIITISSSVWGNVRTESIRGALLPSVKVDKRRESRKAGVFTLRIWSTVDRMIVDKTGSYISQKRSRKWFIQSADSCSESSLVLTSSRWMSSRALRLTRAIEVV